LAVIGPTHVVPILPRMSWLGDLGSAVLGGLYAQRVAVAVIGAAVLVAIAAIARRRGWFQAARRHRSRSAAVLVPALAIALPMGWYLGSPLVLSSTIDEPAPAAAASASTEPATTRPAVSTPPSFSPAEAPPSRLPATATTRPALLAYAGTFHGSDDFHFGNGTARLIEIASGQFVVRLEDFSVRNGPDLYVYLSPDRSGYAEGSLELGRLKADRGNQNYPVPAGAVTDPSRAASVVIWCKQFSHLFATAPLAPG
jgi:hypothetical protein